MKTVHDMDDKTVKIFKKASKAASHIKRYIDLYISGVSFKEAYEESKLTDNEYKYLAKLVDSIKIDEANAKADKLLSKKAIREKYRQAKRQELQKNKTKYSKLRERKIEDMELSTRVVNILHENKIYDLATLAEYSTTDLMQLRHCGKGSVDEIVWAASEFGVKIQ